MTGDETGLSRILIVNPNTSGEFTAKIRAVAERYALPTTRLTVMNPSTGPRSIESVYDELLSAPGTLELVLSRIDDCDGVIVACYSDHPAVAALREATRVPVVGISEASMHVACLLGHSFSVVTTNDAWGPLLRDAVRRYGLAERCASVRTTGLPVLALETPDDRAVRDAILEQARRAIDEDGAEVICLGCAGMAGLDKELEQTLGVPVLDGVVCALKLLEGLLGYGLATSKRRAYATPLAKDLLGLRPIFAAPYSGS